MSASDLRQKLGRLRRTCVRLHRQLSGLRIVFLRLEQSNLKELKPALQLRAGKLAQRLDGLDHTVVEMRERSRVLQEELHLKIEEQGNNSLRVLSVLTALLLPPTLVTGIFGMNTKGLPFTDNESGFPLGGVAARSVLGRGLPHHEAHRPHQEVLSLAVKRNPRDVLVVQNGRSSCVSCWCHGNGRACRRQG